MFLTSRNEEEFFFPFGQSFPPCWYSAQPWIICLCETQCRHKKKNLLTGLGSRHAKHPRPPRQQRKPRVPEASGSRRAATPLQHCMDFRKGGDGGHCLWSGRSVWWSPVSNYGTITPGSPWVLEKRVWLLVGTRIQEEQNQNTVIHLNYKIEFFSPRFYCFYSPQTVLLALQKSSLTPTLQHVPRETARHSYLQQ